VVGEDGRRFQRVEDGRQGLGPDGDPAPRFPEGLAVRRCQQRARTSLVPDLARTRDQVRSGGGKKKREKAI